MDTKEFKIGDRIQFTAGDVIEGTVVQVRDYEPSLGVIWDGYTKITWYISSSGVFNKVDNDISDEDKDLVTDIINNVKAINDGLPSTEEIVSAWKKVVKDLEEEGELRPKVEEDVKVGDRVKYIVNSASDVEFGEEGVVVTIDSVGIADMGVRFDKFNNKRHSLSGMCEKGHGYWVYKEHIKKIEDTKDLENDNKKPVLSPKELLKAGMVVENVKGEFGLFDGEYVIYNDGFDEAKCLNDNLEDTEDNEEFSIVSIYKPTCGYTLQNLDRRVNKFDVIWKKEGFVRKVKKEFSKDELVILEDLYDFGFLYIARDEDGELCAYKSELIKNSCCWAGDSTYYLTYASKLFQCISWEDEKPVKIADFI